MAFSVSEIVGAIILYEKGEVRSLMAIALTETSDEELQRCSIHC